MPCVVQLSTCLPKLEGKGRALSPNGAAFRDCYVWINCPFQLIHACQSHSDQSSELSGGLLGAR